MLNNVRFNNHSPFVVLLKKWRLWQKFNPYKTAIHFYELALGLPPTFDSSPQYIASICHNKGRVEFDYQTCPYY